MLFNYPVSAQFKTIALFALLIFTIVFNSYAFANHTFTLSNVEESYNSTSFEDSVINQQNYDININVFDVLSNAVPYDNILYQVEFIVFNKITLKREVFTTTIGDAIKFDNLAVTVHKCIKKSDPQNPDNIILVTAVERLADKKSRTIFHGWLFSSSISLSTLEHPIYNILCINCLPLKK